jgi:hypothetical protein
MINSDITILNNEIDNIQIQINNIPWNEYKNDILVGFNKLIKEFNGFKKKYGYTSSATPGVTSGVTSGATPGDAFGATPGDAFGATPGDAFDATPIVTSGSGSAPGFGYASGSGASGSGARSSSPKSILKKGSTKQKQFNYEVENKQITIPNTLVIYLTTNVPGFQKIKFVPYMVEPKLNKYVDTVYFDPMIPLNTFVIQKTPRELAKLQFFDKGLFFSLKNRILTEKWFSASDLTSKVLSSMFSNPETVNKNTSVTMTNVKDNKPFDLFNLFSSNDRGTTLALGSTLAMPYFQNPENVNIMRGLVNRGNTLGVFLKEGFMGIKGYFMGATGATGATGGTGTTGNTGTTGAPIIGGSVYRGGSVEDIYESRPVENVKVEKTLEQQLEDAKNNGTIDHNIRTTINLLFKENSVIYLNNKPYTIYACKTTPGDWKIDTNTNLPAFLSTGEYYGPYSGSQDRLLSQGPYSRYPMDRFRQPTFYITNNTANTSSPLQVQTAEKQLSTIPKKLLTGSTHNEKEFSIIPTIHSVEWKYENKPKTSVPIPIEYKNVGEILERNRLNPIIRSILQPKLDKNEQFFIDYNKNDEKNDQLRIGNGSTPTGSGTTSRKGSPSISNMRLIQSNPIPTPNIKLIQNVYPSRINIKSIENGSPKANNNVKRVTFSGGSKNNIIPVNPYYNTSTNFNIFLQHGGKGELKNIKNFFNGWYEFTNVLYQNMSDKEKNYYGNNDNNINKVLDEANYIESIESLTLNAENNNSYFISIADGIKDFNNKNPSNPIVGLDNNGNKDERIEPSFFQGIDMDILKLAIYFYFMDHEYKKYINDNKIQTICDNMNKEFKITNPINEKSYKGAIKTVYNNNNIKKQFFGIKTSTFDEYNKNNTPFQIVKINELKDYIQNTDFMIADIIDMIIQNKYGIKVVTIKKETNNKYDVINFGNIISEENKDTPWSKYMFLLLDKGIYYLMSFNETSIFLRENDKKINLRPPIYIIVLLYIDCFINGLYEYRKIYNNNKSKSNQEVYNKFIKNVHLFKTDFEIFIKTTKTIFNIVSKDITSFDIQNIILINSVELATCEKNKKIIDDLYDVQKLYVLKIQNVFTNKNITLLEQTLNSVNKLVNLLQSEIITKDEQAKLTEIIENINKINIAYKNFKNNKLYDSNNKLYDSIIDLINTERNNNSIYQLLGLIETNFDSYNDIVNNAVKIKKKFIENLRKISNEYNDEYKSYFSKSLELEDMFKNAEYKEAIIDHTKYLCQNENSKILIEGIEGIGTDCKDVNKLANNIIDKYIKSIKCIHDLTIQIENIEFYDWLDGYIKEITNNNFDIQKLFTIVEGVDIKVDDDILFGPIYGPDVPPSPTPVTTGLGSGPKKEFPLPDTPPPDTPPPDTPPPPLDELDILNDQLKREVINAWQEVSYDKDPSKKYWWNKITNETTSIGASKPTGMTSSTPTPTFMSYDSQLKENSKTSFVVFVNLVLYPGTSIPASERKKLACYMNYEEMRRSYAELMGYEYIPKPMNDPSYYKLNNDNKSILKTNTNTNTNTNTRYQPGQTQGQQLPRQTSQQNTRKRVSFNPNPPQRFRGGKNKTKRNHK